MKAKRKPRSTAFLRLPERISIRVASNDGLGDKFTAWMFYDATDTYTGFTLWPTKRMAQAEKDYDDEIGRTPRDGKWRIRKVYVRFA